MKSRTNHLYFFRIRINKYYTKSICNQVGHFFFLKPTNENSSKTKQNYASTSSSLPNISRIMQPPNTSHAHFKTGAAAREKAPPLYKYSSHLRRVNEYATVPARRSSYQALPRSIDVPAVLHRDSGWVIVCTPGIGSRRVLIARFVFV